MNDENLAVFIDTSDPVQTNPEPLDELAAEELLRLTRLMVTAAHSDDWESVTRHDTARRELLAVSPAGTSSDAPVSPVPHSLTEALLAADRALLKCAKRVRDGAVRDTHRARAERGARDTYRRVMSDV